MYILSILLSRLSTLLCVLAKVLMWLSFVPTTSLKAFRCFGPQNLSLNHEKSFVCENPKCYGGVRAVFQPYERYHYSLTNTDNNLHSYCHLCHYQPPHTTFKLQCTGGLTMFSAHDIVQLFPFWTWPPGKWTLVSIHCVPPPSCVPDR